jgi:hypothetical protein
VAPAFGKEIWLTELLIVSTNSPGRRLLPRLLPAIVPFLLLVCSTFSSAAVVTIVLSDDSAPYRETAEAIESVLGKEHSVMKVLADKLNTSDSSAYRATLIVTVGIKATEFVASRGGMTTMLAVLVTEDWYRKRGAALLAQGSREAGVLFLEQPLSRQLRLIRIAFPAASKVGVVVGKGNSGLLEELKGLASKQNLTLIGKVADSENNLVTLLGQVLEEADLLLALPDAEVYNRNTIQSVLMTSYRYRGPVVGYSNAMSRAGAMVSIYSSPAQIGRQAGEITARTLAGGKLPLQQWTKYFSVSVNSHVARSLGIEVPKEEAILDGLGGQK